MSDVTPWHPNTPKTPLKHPQNTSQMTITDFNHESSYLPSWICNIDVRVHICRSTGRCTPHLQTSHGQEWQFQISIVIAHIERPTGRSTPQKYRNTLAKNGNFRFLFSHIGRSTGRSTLSKHTISSLKSLYNGTLYCRQMDCITFNKSNLRNYYNGTLYCRKFTWEKKK